MSIAPGTPAELVPRDRHETTITVNLRYAVLRHEGVAEPHFDLLIEKSPGSPLASWRLPTWPPAADTLAEQIPDHRRDYLVYEGPVTNNRGTVTRVESGTYQHAANKFGIQTYLLAPSNRKIMMRQKETTMWNVWTAEDP